MRSVCALRAWSAIAPGLLTTAHWQQWAIQPSCPRGELALDFSHIPPLVRRRLGPLAKLAFSVADVVLAQASQPDLPVVWVSRYGDSDKSLALLQSQAIGEPLSPMAFGLSVHNAIGAQHSILRGIRSNAVCVATSDGAPEAGVMEALGLLHEGASEVMLVCYEAPLPRPYDRFHDEPQPSYAWAALLALAAPGELGFSLKAIPATTGDICQSLDSGLPHGLEVLHFLLSPARASLCVAHNSGEQQRSGCWLWERCDG